MRDTLDRIERAEPEARRGLVLALLTGLKQICNHPAHFLKQSGAVRLSGRSEKLDLLDELLGTILVEDGAALIFTQYVAMGRLLERHLSAAGLPHQFLHGSVPVREREKMVARFQAGESPVFLLSLKAGGTGLNLTRADHVIHLDRWWNPVVAAWYPDGKDDPHLTLLQFTPGDGRIWVADKGAFGFAYEILKANITKTTPDSGGVVDVNLGGTR